MSNNITTNFRSGWYAVKIANSKEKDVLASLSQFIGLSSRKKIVTIEIDKEPKKSYEHIKVGKKLIKFYPAKFIKDYASPYSFDVKNHKKISELNGYIFIKVVFNEDNDSQQKTDDFRKVELFLKQHIEFTYYIVGMKVELDELLTEKVVNFARKGQKLNTYRKTVNVPTVAKDTEVEKLAQDHNNFSGLVHKFVDFKVDEKVWLVKLTKSGKENLSPVFIYEILDNNLIKVRRYSKRLRDYHKPFTVNYSDLRKIIN